MFKLLLALLTIAIPAHADKISDMPLALPAATYSNDTIPYLDFGTGTMHRIHMGDLWQIPTFTTKFNLLAPKASPVFTGVVTATTFAGDLTGNADTASSLLATPVQCSGQVASGIDANGDANCVAYESGITFSAPLSRSVNTVSIPASTGSVDGYLSSTDWTTFNNKVATSRTISTTAPLTGGGDLSSNLTLAIAASTNSVDGYLSAADHTTFAAKESVLTFSAPLSRSTNTISIPAATDSVAGHLTAADHTSYTTSVAATTAATSSNTASTIVKRNGSGSFSAQTITAEGSVLSTGGYMEASLAGTDAYPQLAISSYSTNGNTQVVGFRSRGTSSASPVAVNDGDWMLDVEGRAYNGTNFQASSLIGFAVDGTNVTGSGNHPGGKILFYTRDTSDTNQYYISKEAMTIRNSGNVGIGSTAPNAKLTVNGPLYAHATGNNQFAMNSTGSYYGFISNNAADVWSLGYGAAIGTIGTPVLTWTSGNVGIGTTSPGAKLEVSGALKTKEIKETVVADGTCSTSFNIDPTLGSVHTLTLSGACAIGVTNLAAGHSFTIYLTQSSTTAPTFTSAYKWQTATVPTFSTSATKYDTISCGSPDGTKLICGALIDNR